MNVDELAQTLTGFGYQRLFQTLDDARLNELWGRPGVPELLQALVSDSTVSSDARFLAAEILYLKQPDYPPAEAMEKLAPVYTEALRHTETGNIWGMPGELDGPAGQHLVILGEQVVDSLLPLLDDPRPVTYEGSKEAMFGNSFAYRVKDLAAYFIAHIRHLPYSLKETPAERDLEIAGLRERL